MKILITGGTGFVGKVLSKKLLDKGHEIYLTSRSETAPESLQSERTHMIQWDALNQDFPSDLLPNELNGVINLMGENIAGKRWGAGQKEKLQDSRIKATENLIAAIKEKPLDFFISASAIGYYPVNHEGSFDEQQANGEGYLAELCQNWENATNDLPENIRKCITRIGVVLGKGGGALSKMLPPFKMGLGGPVGQGLQIMSWIHIEDLTNALIEMAENSQYQGVYNMVAPRAVSNFTFSKALGRALKRPVLFPVPPFVLKMAMGEMSTIVLDSQHILPTKLIESNFDFKYPEIDEALESIVK